MGGRCLVDDKFNDYLRDHMILGFWEKFPELVKCQGIVRDLGLRILTKKHEPWWPDDQSPWKHQLYRQPMRIDLSPDGLMDRVYSLLECDITHTYFGMSFETLLQMDFSSFCELEARVSSVAARVNAAASGLTAGGNNGTQST